VPKKYSKKQITIFFYFLGSTKYLQHPLSFGRFGVSRSKKEKSGGRGGRLAFKAGIKFYNDAVF